MSQKASPTLIGAFTLLGLLIAAGCLVLFGAGKYFERTHRILLHFEKSAIGLQVGSDVRFGGVRIGRVHSINVLIDKQNNRKIIPVVVELSEKELGAIGSASGGGIDFSSEAGVKSAVREGLRAGMKQQSLLTGLLYIEFDIVPDSEGFVYEGPGSPDYPTVPTIATEMDALIAGIGEGLKKFNALDLEGAMSELREVLQAAKDQINNLNTAEISENMIAVTKDVRAITSDKKLNSAIENLDASLVQLKELAAKANNGLDPLLADLTRVLDRATSSLETIDKTAVDLSAASNPRGPVLMRLQSVLDEVDRASRAVKELANDVKRHPNTLIIGREKPTE